MSWSVASAKQQLSEVIRRAADEPQVIFNRDRPVAALVSVSQLEAFMAWRDAQTRRTLGDAFEEARVIAADEGLESSCRAVETEPTRC